MMVKIVEINEEIIRDVPHVIELLFHIFGPKTIGLFAVVVDGELGFVGRDGGNCVYIHKNGYNNFTLNTEEDLAALRKDDIEIFFGESLYFVDKNKIEHSVDLCKLSERDQDDYDGCVSYKQYNPENDTLCEIRYQHMYREIDGKPIIYGYHTRKIDCLYIDEEYTKKPAPKSGILPKRAKYYSKLEFDSDMVGYKLVGIKEYGLFEFMTKGPYELDMDSNIVRYIKTQYIDSEGNYHDFWPLSEQLTTEELVELIKKYNFNNELPWQFIDIYNGRDDFVDNIFEIVKQMKEIKKEALEEQTDRVAILRLKNDEKQN